MAAHVAVNAAGLGDVTGDAVESAASSAEKENAGTTEMLRLKCQWRSKLPLNVAAVRPSPRSPNCPQSPALRPPFSSARTSPDHFSPRSGRPRRNFTRMCPFSFDLRDSAQKVARERRLEELRLMEESRLALSFTFRANPVRKYKPLMVKQSSRQLTVPRSPFSSGEPRK